MGIWRGGAKHKHVMPRASGAMKSSILCNSLEYPSLGYTVWCDGGIGPCCGAKGAALMHDRNTRPWVQRFYFQKKLTGNCSNSLNSVLLSLLNVVFFGHVQWSWLMTVLTGSLATLSACWQMHLSTFTSGSVPLFIFLGVKKRSNVVDPVDHHLL